jgi:hypothetical protein
MSESIREVLRDQVLEGRPSKAKLDKAVKATRLYLGSMTTTRIRDQQKLYDRMMKAANSIATETGMSLEDVLSQLDSQARRLGAMMPTAGKDI